MSANRAARRRRLTAVIATFDRAPILARTLAALAAQSTDAFDVVVVDDGSTDGTAELLTARAAASMASGGPRIVFERQENRGQGAARNRALERTRDAEIVLFLGDDVIPHRDLVAEHLTAHERADAPISVVGFIDWCRGSMQVTPALEMVNREGHQFGFAHMRANEEVPFTCYYTSNVSTPREALGAAPFDPAFTAYGWEDVELGYRLHRQGVKLFYHPAARAEHLHPMSLRDLFARQQLVGAGLATMLSLHPELAGSPLLSPLVPPGWFSLGRHLIPPMVPLASAIDRAGVPLGRRLLHRILLCGFYLGRAAGGRTASAHAAA